MRRITTVLFLVLLAVGAWPVPAHAYFWEWVDSLSGPRYKGFQVEWRVWCRTDSKEQREQLLERMKTKVSADRARYEQARDKARASQDSAAAVPYFQKAMDYLDLALTAIDVAEDMLALQPDINMAYLANIVTAAKTAAVDQFNQGTRVLAGRAVTAEPNNFNPTDVTPAEVQNRMLSSGLGLSLCHVVPGSRDRQFAKLNFGWGYDQEFKADQSRVMLLGGSIHTVAKPWLIIGTGAGVATFTSPSSDRFFKFYVQPTIVDIHFLVVRKKEQDGGPWWPVPHFRYSNIIFPTGFEPGAFNTAEGPSKRFPLELTHSLAVHFDFTSVIRHLQGTWYPEK